MENLKKDFFKYQAQTSNYASGLEIDYAKGSYIYSTDGIKYLDFVAGVSVNTLGHSNIRVNNAIINQIRRYMHVCVYGEYSLKPSVELCKKLVSLTPNNLEQVYLVNSGTEAIEASLKLAKRYTGRHKIISFEKSYHGNTHGSLSVSGVEDKKRAFRPLLPEVYFIQFNNFNDINKIDSKTAAVIVESIRGASGFETPDKNYLKFLKKRCKDVGALLIIDEIQPGIGRTGKLFAFEHYGISPDILVMGKGLANGLPIGAFMSSAKIMSTFKENPSLGHITTFGGNPVIAAAALEVLNIIYDEEIMSCIDEKESIFRNNLNLNKILRINGKGLMLAIELEDAYIANKLIIDSLDKGLILFWLMYNNKNVRITPALNISKHDILKGCKIINNILKNI